MSYIPTATYRLQLSHDFTLAELKDILQYLHKLGVSTIYAAPVFSAREGSTHGYDVTNPHQLNPAIGQEKEFREIADWLKTKQMGWLQDVVPNHMAYSMHNSWLSDVLEKGPNSPYYSYFDLWEDVRKDEPFMTPFLGDTLENCLKNEEIELTLNEGTIFFNYYDKLYPLSLPSYALLFDGLKNESLQDVTTLATQLATTYQANTAVKLKEALKKSKSALKPHLKKFTAQQDKMESLLSKQYYRLCWWKETENKINYRRFFTVNDLICLNIQKPEVFTAYHRYIKELLEKGQIQGLRIDHIDGLYDPAKYLHDLRELTGDDTYLLIEKILEQKEEINPDWPIHGTTGYDFLSQLNALFVNKEAEETFTRLYREVAGPIEDFESLVWENKKLILHQRMQGEFNNLLSLYHSLGLHTNNISEEQLSASLSCLLLAYPVYRTYINSYPFSQTDIKVLERTFAKAEKYIPENANAALEHLKTIFHPEEKGEQDKERLLFIQRIQQISGPLEAKGLEDTTFYSYNRLTSLNEVGGQPQHFGMEVNEFHSLMEARQQVLPLTLNATATHDTKRGEDVRQRLNALSEIPDSWHKQVLAWHKQNRSKKTEIQGSMAPDANDEYFIYQSLLAFYPARGEHSDSFIERINAYLQKALREGKRHSNWSSPNTAYEEATESFIKKLLKDDKFMNDVLPLMKDLSRQGMLKSFSQVLIKMFAPGIPDVYQGTELPDLSMVDPDNRRKVNYEKRSKWLDALLKEETNDRSHLHQQLVKNTTDGRLKLYLTHKLLVFRRQHPDLFSKGSYIPVKVVGKQAGKVLAFIRKHEAHSCLVVAPLFPTLVSNNLSGIPSANDWENTQLQLPDDQALPEKWENGLTGEKHQSGDGVYVLSDLLGQLPLAFLKGGNA
jgi:(1->4)-alpha-D-glucan 1-alpha-D-glucosylmutase